MIRSLTRTACIALAAAHALACAPSARDARAAAATDTLVYTGTVVDGGTSAERIVVLEQAGGDLVRLAGPLEAELARLAGGTVRATGTWSSTYGGALDVTTYRLVSMDGVQPIVGVLRERAGELWLDAEPATRLVAPPEALRALVGARIWVVGTSDRNGVRLQSYGVIVPGSGS